MMSLYGTSVVILSSSRYIILDHTDKYWIYRCHCFLVRLMASLHNSRNGGSSILVQCQSWECLWSVVWLSLKRFWLWKMKMETLFGKLWKTMMSLFSIRFEILLAILSDPLLTILILSDSFLKFLFSIVFSRKFSS